MTQHYDALIIGSGVAGLSAALNAPAAVAVVSDMAPTEVLSSMAQGGINAAIAPGDSVQQHATDTFKAGGGVADFDRVLRFCEAAPEATKWLKALGMPFERGAGGVLAVRQMAGHTKPRTLHGADYTGLRLVQTLYDQCLKAGVEFISDHTLYALSQNGGAISGAVLLDRFSQKPVAIAADRVIMATGGYAGIYTPHTTAGSFGSGRGVALAAQAGASLSDLHLVQFHPTALLSGQLLSEAARGYGAAVIDERGEAFVDALLPRDQLARAIAAHMEQGHRVYLDLRPIDGAVLEGRLAQEVALARRFGGVDPRIEPVPIAPAAHYSMGGIEVDEAGCTAVPGLLACGECAQAGIHGANRLGGNSLLEAVVYGCRAGKATRWRGEGGIQTEQLERARSELADQGARAPIALNRWRRELGALLFDRAGLIRRDASLEQAKAKLASLQEALESSGAPVGPYLQGVSGYLDAQAAIFLSKELIDAAIAAEPVGAHYKEAPWR